MPDGFQDCAGPAGRVPAGWKARPLTPDSRHLPAGIRRLPRRLAAHSRDKHGLLTLGETAQELFTKNERIANVSGGVPRTQGQWSTQLSLITRKAERRRAAFYLPSPKSDDRGLRRRFRETPLTSVSSVFRLSDERHTHLVWEPPQGGPECTTCCLNPAIMGTVGSA